MGETGVPETEKMMLVHVALPSNRVNLVKNPRVNPNLVSEPCLHLCLHPCSNLVL